MESSSEPLLSVRGLSKRFPVARDWAGRPTSWLWAVDFVDLDLHAGETLAVVGESGGGKTTLARLILRLLPASSGSVRFERLDVLAAGGRELRSFRRRAQLVFQDPFGSLDPRLTVEAVVGEGMPPELSRDERRERARGLLDLVELSADAAGRFPHEFSGGERQRISIARALAVEPALLVLDEPVSALDMSVQSAILNLLLDLQERLSLTYLLISHDLSVVRHVADRIAVMYLGRIVETGSAKEIFENPLHPYTQALLSSVPALSRRSVAGRIVPGGEAPSPIDPPACCRFTGRCFRSIARCGAEVPLLEAIATDTGHRVACFNYAPIGEALRAPARPAPEPGERAPPTSRRRQETPALARFVGRRLAYAAFLLLIGSVLIFFGMNAAPGRVRVNPADVERMGLDRPAAAQYAAFVKNLLSGDPGNSFVNGARIGDIVRDSGANTLKLGLAAVILVYTFAIPLGVICAWRRNSTGDQATRILAVLAMGIPNFFLAILLIQLFAVELGWLPVSGPGGFEHLVLPAVVLALESLAINMRLTRSSMLDELSREYVRALRAKGLTESRVLWVHALRNALVPVIAFAGTLIPLILGYTLVVEVVFRFQGLGYQLVQAITNRDYVLGTTLALLFMAVVLLCNLAADVAHRLVDPRVRESGRQV